MLTRTAYTLSVVLRIVVQSIPANWYVVTIASVCHAHTSSYFRLLLYLAVHDGNTTLKNSVGAALLHADSYTRPCTWLLDG